jgi:hypothetical protein
MVKATNRGSPRNAVAVEAARARRALSVDNWRGISDASARIEANQCTTATAQTTLARRFTEPCHHTLYVLSRVPSNCPKPVESPTARPVV